MRQQLIRVVAGACLAMTIPAWAAASDPKADDVLAGVRRAIGGQALERARSVTLAGEFERTIGDAQMTGAITLEVVQPDKVRRDEQLETPMGPGPTIVSVVDGSTAWRDVENTSMAGMHVMIRRPEGQAAPDDGAPLRAEFQRLLLGITANTSLLGLEATYAGQAESPDGVADVIEFRDATSFAAKLFVDRETRLPLMLSWTGVPPQARMRMMRGAPGAGRPPDAQAAAEADAAAAAKERPQPVEMQMFFAEHRTTAGLTLPTRITFQVAGKPSEEWRFTSTKVDAPIKADRFRKPSNSAHPR